MKCKFINVLMFAAGAAIGSAVTYKVVKTQYDRIIQEEIESVKEVFANNPALYGEGTDEGTSDDESELEGQIDWSELEDLDEDDEDDDKKQYAKIAENYTTEKGGSITMAKGPYVISPYDFGEIDGYSLIELTYYADGVLEDEEYNIVEDVDELIGNDSLYTFGEYEEDAVFVRNEHLRADFQILKDPRTYTESRKVGPKQVGD